MQELKTVIANFLKKAGLEKGVSQNNALLIWKDVVGEKVSQNTAPEKVESGTLYVKAISPTWRKELVFKKADIIEKMNKQLGKNTIKEIKFI